MRKVLKITTIDDPGCVVAVRIDGVWETLQWESFSDEERRLFDLLAETGGEPGDLLFCEVV